MRTAIGGSKYVGLDVYEEGAVIKALNDMRTKQLAEGRPTDVENKLILKIIRTPTRKSRIRNEAR